MGLQREVAGVQKLDGGVGVVTQEGLRAWRDEERIILTPDGQQRRLGLAKIFLEGGEQLHVVGVVEKQVQLNVHVSGPLNDCGVEWVTLRRNVIALWDTVRVLGAEALGAQSVAENFAVLQRWFSPITLDGSPGVAKPFFIRVAILRNDGGNPFWASHR